MIFLFMVPVEGIFSYGSPLVISTLYIRFPLLPSLLSPLVPELTAFEGDLSLGDSSLSLFPLYMYSVNWFLFINPSMEYFSWMQSSVLWL